MRGEQHIGGGLRRYVWVGPVCLTGAQARVLARALISAADELDDLAEQDWHAGQAQR
jgi:hypothetical protein